MNEVAPKFYKTAELSKLLNVTPSTLKTWVKKGLVPAPTMIGRNRLFDRVAIDEFLLFASQEFIEKTSTSTWDAKYLALLSLQKDIDLKTSVMSSLISSLDSYLNTL